MNASAGVLLIIVQPFLNILAQLKRGVLFCMINFFTYYYCFFKEIKICGTPQDDCSEFATCADTGPGSYICTCNKGFTGDGKTCKGDWKR